MPRIRINLETCNRTGMCYLEHADLFADDDDGYPLLQPGAADRILTAEDAARVIEVCPTGSLLAIADSEAEK